MSCLRLEAESVVPDKSSPHVVYIATSKYGGDWHSTLHSHQCTELFYVVSGKGRFRIEELDFAVEANELVIVNSYVEHTEYSVPQSPMEYIVVGIDGVAFLQNSASDSRYCKLENKYENKKIFYYLREIFSEMEKCSENYGVITDHLLELISYKLLRQKQMSITERTSGKVHAECARAKKYIDENFMENISLSYLADMVHMSKYYFSHSFVKEYGVSPIGYLQRKKINESKYLLAQTNHSISQIAQIVGFSSANYFTQSFKRMEAMSPSEFRKKMGGRVEESRSSDEHAKIYHWDGSRDFH